MVVKIEFLVEVPPADPSTRPCSILGKKENLKLVPFAKLTPYLGTKVTEETWQAGVDSLSTRSSSSCSLWLDKASVGGIPSIASRHNTPSRSHALNSLVQRERKNGERVCIIVVCSNSEVLASGCAISRAFPLFNRKSGGGGGGGSNQVIEVSFIPVGSGAVPFTPEDVKCLDALSEGIRLAQEIVDAPPNFMHTDAFLDKIREVGQTLKIEPLIIQGQELEEKKFGGIYGVGKAAVHQPALAVLSHTPSGASETICWVGKGIVYDTGGLSIKGKMAMPGMKRDCGGAAGILGAFQAAVKLGFKQNLHALFCLAENAVGPIATRPDDIHTLYSGKTVEINNTDAEGRLVLGDGVAYARNVLKANWVVDMATLTGAQGISTGVHHAAVLTNCEASQTAVQEAGRTSGDLTFPIPYTPELHFKEFDSAVADMKNSVMNRANAQSSCAGLFIGAHLGFDYSGIWIHIDMASPVHCGERATGYGVALLTTLYGQRSENSLLQSSAPVLEKTDSVDMQ